MNKKIISDTDQSNKICYLDLLPADNNVLSSILEHIIVTSPQPTNTAITLMYTSQQWLTVNKGLFERNTEVLASFARQIETLASDYSPWSDKSHVSYHQNTLFFVWMVNYLKDKKITLWPQTILKSEVIKSKEQGLLADWSKNVCTKNLTENECITIIEHAFVNPTILQEITFEAHCLLYEQSFCMSNCQVTDKEYFSSLTFEILLHVTRNSSAIYRYLLIEKVAKKISTNYDKFTIDNTPNYVLYQNAYKLARLIETLGNFITEKSSNESKSAYLSLIEQFLHSLHWYHGLKIITFLEGYHFANLGVKFIQLVQHQLPAIPVCTFNLIHDLKRFREKYELVSDIIENILKSSHYNLENVLKIKNMGALL